MKPKEKLIAKREFTDWDIIAMPRQKIVCSYLIVFPPCRPEYVEKDVLFFSGLEEVTENRIIKTLQSGWINTPEIKHLIIH